MTMLGYSIISTLIFSPSHFSSLRITVAVSINILHVTGDKNSIKFEWSVGEWTDCSPSCGGTGFQVSYTLLYQTNPADKKHNLHLPADTRRHLSGESR